VKRAGSNLAPKKQRQTLSLQITNQERYFAQYLLYLIETPSPKEAPNQGPSDVVAILEVWTSNLCGAWGLGFGASRRSDSIENSEEADFLAQNPIS